jgi:predicted 3-demethylubiquinone-9 3-methyltransferase (glyoxalase superfamily)
LKPKRPTLWNYRSLDGRPSSIILRNILKRSEIGLLKLINLITLVSTYLNFAENTVEAFNFYKSVSGGEFTGGIKRFRDVPSMEGMPAIPENEMKVTDVFMKMKKFDFKLPG